MKLKFLPIFFFATVICFLIFLAGFYFTAKFARLVFENNLFLNLLFFRDNLVILICISGYAFSSFLGLKFLFFAIRKIFPKENI
jgi:hypothetical protein